VYDVINDTGKVVSPTQAYSASISTSGYYLVSPIGASGIALLGDKGKFVSLGKKRVSAYTDDGAIGVTLQFATGEGQISLQGYAPKAPTVSALAGTVGTLNYNPSTQRFTVPVMPAGTTASIKIVP
jgi:hypothetical protein